MSRIVHYFLKVRDVTLSAELRLWRGIASGVFSNGDCHSACIWFEGPPGAAMRELRDQIHRELDRPEVPLGVRRRQLVAQCGRAHRQAERRRKVAA